MKWLPGLIGDINRPKMDRSWRVNIVAPMAHRGPRTSQSAKCKGCWLPGLNGKTYCTERLDVYDIYMKCLPGLIGDITRLKMDRSWRGSCSGSNGSQGTRTSEIAKCKGHWVLVAPGAQWGHIVHRPAIWIWHWHEVAPRAQWVHKTSEMDRSWLGSYSGFYDSQGT